MKQNHEWVRRARIFMLDNYHPPFWPELSFDAKKLVDVARKYHANAIRFGSAGKWSVFPNEFWPSHPELNGRDLITEVVEEAHAHDMRVVVYIPTGHIIPQDNILKYNPEWLYRSAPGAEPKILFHHGGGPHSPPCVNTPYRDAYMGFVKQLISDHEIDGIYTDSGVPFHSHGGHEASLCYCDYCLEKFRREFDCEMPYADDPTTLPLEQREMLEKFSLETGRGMADMLIEGAEFAREKRDIPVLTHGCAMAAWPEFRFMNTADGILYEAGGEFFHRLESASLGETSGLAMWQYVGGLTPWSRLQWFSQELVEEAAASFACGGAIIAACGTNLMHGYPEKFHHELAALFGTLEENESLFDKLHPTPFAAIPFILPMRFYERLETHRFRAEPLVIRERPNETMLGYPFSIPSQKVSIQGAFSAVTVNHLPAQLVNQETLSNPEKLARFPLLYLPNIGYLTEAEIECVTDYVRAGGRLLASYRTSLYGPEPEELLENFALADLLGIDRMDCEPQHLKDYQNHLWCSGTFDMYARSVPGKWLAETFPEQVWPISRFEFVKTRPETEVLANFVFGGREDEPLWPAVTSREFGNGRVVYIAAAVEQLHREYRMSMIRDLIGAVIDWLCPEGRPIAMDGPDQLLAIPNEKPGAQVLFLVNHTGERMEELAKIWPQLSKQIDYVSPVSQAPIRWRLNESKTPRRVWDVCTGKDLDVSIDGSYLTTTLKDIGQYAIIAVEY